VKAFFAALAFLLLAPCAWGAQCTITGQVFNPDGTPLANGTVQFNSVVQQTLQGGATIPPTQVSTGTDPQGNIGAFSLVQGLQGQFTFCSPSAGGCGNPTPVLIPVSATADISAILIGIQLSSGGNINGANLNLTGNAIIGGSLQVTGPATFNGPAVFDANACFADQGCWGTGGIVSVTHVGIGAIPALSATQLQVGNTAILSTIGTPDSLGTNINMNFASGVHMNSAGQWIADVSYPMWFNQVSAVANGAENGWMAFGPQTIGQPISLTNRVQYMALRSNTPGNQSGPGLFLESGGIDVINGGITANGGSLGTGITLIHYQNGPTIIQSQNTDGNDPNSAALVRTYNSAGHVNDLGMTGGQANLGGFFTADRGYVASNGANGLLLEATGAGAGAQLFLSAPNSNLVAVIGNQHFAIENNGVSVPHVVGTCGGGGQMASNAADVTGSVDVGPNPDTSCVIQIASSWNSASCVCSTRTNTWCSINPSNSGFTMQFGAALTGWVSWICLSNG
jgi:hypothetical protein